MASYRNVVGATLYSATVSGVTPVLSAYLTLATMPFSFFTITVGAGLTATFQLMASDDGVNFLDTGMILPSASGSAVTIPVVGPGWAPYLAIQITPSSGSGSVVIKGSATK